MRHRTARRDGHRLTGSQCGTTRRRGPYAPAQQAGRGRAAGPGTTAAAATAARAGRPARRRHDRPAAVHRVRRLGRLRQGRRHQAAGRPARPAPRPGRPVRRADVRREAAPLPVALLAELPGWGGMAVLDRSWYGRVLVERVEGFATEEQWRRAYDEIVEFERTLVAEGMIIVKFWMHISDDEQLRRFESRANDPLKRWKLTDEDWRNREKRRPVRGRRRGDARAHRPPGGAVARGPGRRQAVRPRRRGADGVRRHRGGDGLHGGPS